MRFRTSLAAALCALLVAPAFAHRLDEYLQGTLIAVERGRLEAQMTLTSGVAIFPVLLAFMDTNADGIISESEQRAYAEQVLLDLSFSIDGRPLIPQLLSIRFPATDEMKEGRGEIRLAFGANLPAGGRRRKLILENHHQSRISVYQVNSLVPRDPSIRISGQDRNFSQSIYQLQYEQAGVGFSSFLLSLWSEPFVWLGGIALLLLLRLAFLWRTHSAALRLT